jgi:hypothetical protein
LVQKILGGDTSQCRKDEGETQIEAVVDRGWIRWIAHHISTCLLSLRPCPQATLKSYENKKSYLFSKARY